MLAWNIRAIDVEGLEQEDYHMEISELLQAFAEHNKTGNGYQIELNSGNLDEKSNKNKGVEFNEIYFIECSMLRNKTLLCFGNMNRKPVGQKEDGTKLYPQEINSNMFIDISKIEAIEEVKEFEDWFSFPSQKVFNIYMLPENKSMDGNRNVISVGFM